MDQVRKFSYERGTFRYENGDRFTGRIHNKIPCNGTYSFHNGDIFSGSFTDGKVGCGIYFYFASKTVAKVENSKPLPIL
jgi:hypothetical protein